MNSEYMHVREVRYSNPTRYKQILNYLLHDTHVYLLFVVPNYLQQNLYTDTYKQE